MIYIENIFIYDILVNHIYFFILIEKSLECCTLRLTVSDLWVGALWVVTERSTAGGNEHRHWSQAVSGLGERCLTSLCLNFLNSRMELGKNLPSRRSL